MKITEQNEICISAIVNRFKGKPDIVVENLADLSSWELLGNSPGPDSKYLSTNDLELLAKIYSTVVSPLYKPHKNQVLSLLEDVIGQNLDIREVRNILDQIDNSID